MLIFNPEILTSIAPILRMSYVEPPLISIHTHNSYSTFSLYVQCANAQRMAFF